MNLSNTFPIRPFNYLHPPRYSGSWSVMYQSSATLCWKPCCL